MQAFTPRAARRSLARTIVMLTAAATLGACADETTAPAANAPLRAAANAQAASRPDQYTTSVDLFAGNVTVDPVYGTSVEVAVSCSSDATFDVVVELDQEQRQAGAMTLVQGSNRFDGVMCTTGSASFRLDIDPYTPGAFQVGRAMLRARIENQQPDVEPAALTRRVKLNAAPIE